MMKTPTLLSTGLAQRMLAMLTAATVLVATLGGCGGSAGAGAQGGSTAGGSTADVATLEISLAKNTLLTATTDSTAFTVVAKDSGNRAMKNVPVVVTSSGGVVTQDATITNASGALTGSLGVTAGDRSNRSITVTATAGGTSANAVISISGTTLSGTPDVTTADVNEAVRIVYKLTDSSNKPIANSTVTVKSNAGTQTVSTDAGGTAVVRLASTTAGTNTVTATAANADANAIAIQVGGSSLQITSSVTDIPVNAPAQAQTMTVKLRKDSVPQAGVPVTLSATRGTISPTSVTTDGSGQATFALTPVTQLSGGGTKQSSVGPVTIYAQAGAVTGRLDVAFVSTIPADFSVQANPTVLQTNANGITTNRSTVSVTVLDGTVDKNPVKGATVRFTIISDPSGGTLSAPLAVTDAQGIAKIDFVSGARGSGSDQVVIGVAVDSVAAKAKPANGADPNQVNLTVIDSGLFVSIGTNNKIEQSTDFLSNIKSFKVRVTNSAGQAVAGAAVSTRLLPLRYAKGTYVWDDPAGAWIQAVTTTCANEDVNNDGIWTTAEDLNQDAKLWPGQVAVIRPSASETLTTDSDGAVTVTVTHTKSFSNWARYQIEVAAKITGSEGRATYDYWLAGLVDDYLNKNVPPPGRNSPYGTGNSCLDPS